jgi:hypothetical protein
VGNDYKPSHDVILSKAKLQRSGRKSTRPGFQSRIIITALEPNGPEIFRFAQDDSVVGILNPALFTNETDVSRHARRDRRAHSATSDAYVAAGFVSKCKCDDRLRPGLARKTQASSSQRNRTSHEVLRSAVTPRIAFASNAAASWKGVEDRVACITRLEVNCRAGASRDRANRGGCPTIRCRADDQ